MLLFLRKYLIRAYILKCFKCGVPSFPFVQLFRFNWHALWLPKAIHVLLLVYVLVYMKDWRINNDSELLKIFQIFNFHMHFTIQTKLEVWVDE